MSTATTTETNIVRYRLAPEQSSFTVQAFAEGLFSAFAHDPVIAIRDFEGEAQFVPGTLEAAAVKLRISAQGLALTGDTKEKDRVEIETTMRNQVLEVEKYPEVVFSSSNISASRVAEGRYRVRVIGDLSFHGVTQKNVWITSEATVSDQELRVRGDFSLKQSDFGFKPF